MSRLAAVSNSARQDVVVLAAQVAAAADSLLAEATAAVRSLALADGKLSAEALEREQATTHGLAWLATYVESIRQLASYSDRMRAAGFATFGPSAPAAQLEGSKAFAANLRGICYIVKFKVSFVQVKFVRTKA